ncbi:MAG: hypothetical protein M3081_14095 [Gemmatimonadota bacterium]|nr:hypothetical protein [Gemmatimonadota bacterium]
MRTMDWEIGVGRLGLWYRILSAPDRKVRFNNPSLGTLECRRNTESVPKFRLQGGRMNNLLFRRIGS